MNIGIVGAGIVGRLMALAAIKQGHSVTLFDKTYTDDFSTTSQVAAGMLSPYSELETGETHIASLGQDAIARWQAIMPQLTPAPTLHTEGSLLLAKSQNAPELEHFMNRAKRLGLIFSLINDREISALEPDLSGQGLTGIYLRNEGCLDTKETLQALASTLRMHPITWHENTRVTQIACNTVFTESYSERFDQVFDCRGLGAKAELKDLRAVRGELILLHAPDVNIHRPLRLLHPRYPLYIIPRKNNHYMIGATSIESEDYSPISVQSTLELLSACYSVHPGFAEARVVQTATQCRPTFSNHRPTLLKTNDCIHINGMYRYGFLLGPKMVAEALTYLQGEKHESMVQ